MDSFPVCCQEALFIFSLGVTVMEYVLGIDLGTSSVKVVLVDKKGTVSGEAVREYELIQTQAGYSEQNPEDWITQTLSAVAELTEKESISPQSVKGISFSGQMHGLVLVDANCRSLRPAILWNDTRTTPQCQEIVDVLGESLLDITKNKSLEGFTLPKLLWVKQHEPEIYEKACAFVLPKDYVRYRLTGALHMEYSDAAGTLLFDVTNKEWSEEICNAFSISATLCPELVSSYECVGTLLPDMASAMGLAEETKVFAGGADNACGALGAGIVNDGAALCSIGTSGVLLSYEANKEQDFRGSLHFFNHAKPNSFYLMGVTLAAGYSLSWFKNTFAKEKKFEEMLQGVSSVPIGSNGLLFTPYLAGERTPYADSNIRASFIGMDGSHSFDHFARAVLEGITFSLRDSLELMRTVGKKEINKIISIGGGAKNELWLQMQADIFNATVVNLTSEQGPALGAAIIASVGCGWFDTFEACTDTFIQYEKEFSPIPENVIVYEDVYHIYKDVYQQTKDLNQRLHVFR
jgi:xylulokinase